MAIEGFSQLTPQQQERYVDVVAQSLSNIRRCTRILLDPPDSEAVQEMSKALGTLASSPLLSDRVRLEVLGTLRAAEIRTRRGFAKAHMPVAVTRIYVAGNEEVQRQAAELLERWAANWGRGIHRDAIDGLLPQVRTHRAGQS